MGTWGSGTIENARNGFGGAVRGTGWASDERVTGTEHTVNETINEATYAQPYSRGNRSRKLPT